VDEILLSPLGDWKLWTGLAVLFTIALLRLRATVQPIVESVIYGRVFLILVGCGFALSALSFYRFITAWKAAERLLDRLCHTWLLRELAADYQLFDWKPMKSFGWRMPTFKMVVALGQKLREVEKEGLLGSGTDLASLDNDLAEAFKAEREGKFISELKARRRLIDSLDNVVHSVEGKLPPDGESPPTAILEAKVLESKATRIISQLLALRVVAYLRYVFAHLRNCLLSAMLTSLLVLVGTTLYAFEPKQLVSFGIWVALLAGTLLTIWVFVQMDRNGALSAIGHSDSGQVSFDRTFFTNVFTYGIIPVLGVVLTQFPVVGRIFTDWLAPLLRVTGVK
jgi:hypothetical protein